MPRVGAFQCAAVSKNARGRRMVELEQHAGARTHAQPVPVGPDLDSRGLPTDEVAVHPVRRAACTEEVVRIGATSGKRLNMTGAFRGSVEVLVFSINYQRYAKVKLSEG